MHKKISVDTVPGFNLEEDPKIISYKIRGERNQTL
jgi:hypothetical protein